VSITKATLTTFGNNSLLAIFGKICQQFFVIKNNSTRWHQKHYRLAIFAMTSIATTLLAILGCPELASTIFREGTSIVAGTQNNVTTITTITAIWATFGITFGTMKAKIAITTVTGLYFYCSYIYKHIDIIA